MCQETIRLLPRNYRNLVKNPGERHKIVKFMLTSNDHHRRCPSLPGVSSLHVCAICQNFGNAFGNLYSLITSGLESFQLISRLFRVPIPKGSAGSYDSKRRRPLAIMNDRPFCAFQTLSYKHGYKTRLNVFGLGLVLLCERRLWYEVDIGFVILAVAIVMLVNSIVVLQYPT